MSSMLSAILGHPTGVEGAVCSGTAAGTFASWTGQGCRQITVRYAVLSFTWLGTAQTRCPWNWREGRGGRAVVRAGSRCRCRCRALGSLLLGTSRVSAACAVAERPRLTPCLPPLSPSAFRCVSPLCHTRASKMAMVDPHTGKIMKAETVWRRVPLSPSPSLSLSLSLSLSHSLSLSPSLSLSLSLSRAHAHPLTRWRPAGAG